MYICNYINRVTHCFMQMHLVVNTRVHFMKRKTLANILKLAAALVPEAVVCMRQRTQVYSHSLL